MRIKFLTILLTSVFCSSGTILADTNKKVVVESTQESTLDPNFYVFICFGQSNMEGNAPIEASDTMGVIPRFRVMAVCDGIYSGEQRHSGSWYNAVPPLCRQNTGLTPADYFGRVLTDSLPDSIRIGIVMVAIGGAGIDAFDKDHYKAYYTNSNAFQKYLMDVYGGDPYAKLVEMAKRAQQAGVIKGILLHQGESNNCQEDWLAKVKKIYDDLMIDLNLTADSIPLLAGEMRYQNQGGICWEMNRIMNRLPQIIKNSYVISADGCQGNTVDGFHFSTAGTRELGRRYGRQMWSFLKTRLHD